MRPAPAASAIQQTGTLRKKNSINSWETLISNGTLGESRYCGRRASNGQPTVATQTQEFPR